MGGWKGGWAGGRMDGWTDGGIGRLDEWAGGCRSDYLRIVSIWPYELLVGRYTQTHTHTPYQPDFADPGKTQENRADLDPNHLTSVTGIKA